MPAPGTVRNTTSVADALRAAVEVIAAASATPRLDAELLLQATCQLGRAAQRARPERPLGPDEQRRFFAAVAQRGAGVPVAYIVGSREFHSILLNVTPDVLVPRPETELLVDLTLQRMQRRSGRVLDLGTGSGAIALAVKAGRPDLDVMGSDVDEAAIRVAQRNCASLGLDVELLQSDWFAKLGDAEFDVIATNPPYVESAGLPPDGPLRHEPRLALDGGCDGLEACRRILQAAARHLVPDGRLLIEHGFDQRNALCALATEHGYRIASVHDDLAGLPRVVALAFTESRQPRSVGEMS